MDKYLRHFDIETYRDDYTIELTCRLCGSGEREVWSYTTYAKLEDIVIAASDHFYTEHARAQS